MDVIEHSTDETQGQKSWSGVYNNCKHCAKQSFTYK
jgi:hypothetical protein